MPSNRFEQQLKQRFEGARMTPSPQVWERIAHEVAPPQQKNNRKILPLFWLAAAACAALLLGVYLGGRTTEPAPPLVTSHQDGAAEQLSSPKTTLSEDAKVSSGYSPGEKTSPDLRPASAVGSQTLHGNPPQGEQQGVMSTQLPADFSQEPLLAGLSSNRLPLVNSLEIQDLEPAGIEPRAPILPTDLEAASLTGNIPGRKRWAVGGFVQLGGQESLQPVTLQTSLPSNLVVADPNVIVSSDNLDLASTVSIPPRFKSISLFAEYFVAKGLSLQSGLGLMRFHQPLVLAASQKELDLGLAPNAPSYNELNYSLLEFPLLANYYIGRKRSALKVTAGLAYQALISRQPALDYSYSRFSQASALEETTQVLPVLQTSLWRLQGKLQYQYHLGEKMALFVGPMFSYHLTPVMSTAEESPAWAAGLELGLKWYM